MTLLVSKNPQSNWPNIRTLLNTTNFIVNIISQVSIPDKLWQVNLPFRICSFKYAIYKADYCRASADVVAYAALMLPYGGFIAGVIDGIMEWQNYNNNLPSRKEPKQKKIRQPPEVNKETAYRMFELSEDSPLYKNNLEAKYNNLKNELESKKAKLPEGELTEDLDEVIKKLELNYQFLLTLSSK